MHPFFRSVTLALTSLALLGAAPVSQRPVGNKSAATSVLTPYVATRTSAAFDLAGTGKLDQAAAEALQTFSVVATYGSDRDAEAFRQAAFARRLFAQLRSADAETQAALLPVLRDNDELTKVMAFAVPSTDKSKTVLPLLAKLIKDRPQVVKRFPELAVAIALVHDKPLERRVNENSVTAADPLPLLDYFSSNEARLSFGLHTLPVDLLVYVVDTTCSVNELSWAMQNYAGNRNVGALFFNVRYDFNNLTLGRDKDVTRAGYTLPNILKYGGVCADQAYFATEVAKAIGVPSAYTRASNGESSHAWVGFLQGHGKGGMWNFDSGRYEAYRNVRGDVTDPVFRRPVPDSYVSLLGESVGADPVVRQTAAAYTDAARLLIPRSSTTAPASTSPFTPPALPPELGEIKETAREGTAQGSLELLEMGLRRDPYYLAGWLAVGDLAQSGQMTLEQKRKWGELIQRLTGGTHPDFALALFDPMIQTVEDADAQSRMWESLYRSLQSRPDLAARVLMREAELMEKKGNLSRAGRIYEDVIRMYVNTTPYALVAVQKAEGVLKQMGREKMVLPLYQLAANAAQRPKQAMATEFMKQSNWYKLRAAYAQKLIEAGRESEARGLIPEETQSQSKSPNDRRTPSY